MAKHCLIDAAMAKPLLLVFFFIFSLFSIALLPHTAARTARTAADWPAFILDSWGSFVARSLQTTVTTKPSWCIAKTSIDDSTMQAALDYACGQTTADCEPIKFGGPCFFPNTVEDHASYVFNSYYQVNAKGSSTCNFGGAAMVTTTNPSHGSCIYPSSGSLNQSTKVQTSSASGLVPGIHMLLFTCLCLSLVTFHSTFIFISWL